MHPGNNPSVSNYTVCTLPRQVKHQCLPYPHLTRHAIIIWSATQKNIFSLPRSFSLPVNFFIVWHSLSFISSIIYPEPNVLPKLGNSLLSFASQCNNTLPSPYHPYVTRYRHLQLLIHPSENYCLHHPNPQYLLHVSRSLQQKITCYQKFSLKRCILNTRNKPTIFIKENTTKLHTYLSFLIFLLFLKNDLYLLFVIYLYFLFSLHDFL